MFFLLNIPRKGAAVSMKIAEFSLVMVAAVDILLNFLRFTKYSELSGRIADTRH